MLLLLDLLAKRPRRSVASTRPIGRLLRDFERALDDRDEATARALLFGPILATGRLSGLNRLFLHVRLLAVFEKWTDLKEFPFLGDLLRANRPALVSDALAMFALQQLRVVADDTGQSRVSAFETAIAPRFGSLIPTIERIRSAASAEYYVRWYLNAGDDPEAVRGRFNGLGWLELPEVAALLVEQPEAPASPISTLPSLESITEAVVDGRFDRAIELLSLVEPARELLPVLVWAVSQTLSVAAVELLAGFRHALGDIVVDGAIAELHERHGASLTVNFSQTAGWAERIRMVAAGELSPAELETTAEEGALFDLVRDPRQLAAVVDAVQSTASAASSTSVLEAVLLLLRRLRDVVPERDRRHLSHLRFAVISLWALGDASGDQSLAHDILDEVERLLEAGCSTDEFQELLELLTVRWSPFLTDVAFGLGVRAMEVLAAGQPAGVHALGAFAVPIFGRITTANVERLDLADVLAADALSTELDLGFSIARLRADDIARQPKLAAWSGRIGMYSLDENALRRAAAAVRLLLPSADVRTAHDEVATDPLRSLAANTDVMIVATRVAKHQATEAIRDARGDAPITFASGKGSSSLLRAVLQNVDELLVPA